MSDQFVAEIRIFGFNFPPTGWAFCSGQLLPISQNTALFSLLGTFYGGDGKSTFALPNLDGSFPIGQGQGPGLTDRFIGEASGTQNVTLLETEMPQHAHAMSGTNAVANAHAPDSNTLASSPAKAFHPGPPDSSMSFNELSVAGSSFPHNNMPPFEVLNFCIAMQGIFPPRS